jgi:hypothetical protein
MATWRCPHCGTPQKEAARCWVCHRSTTSCSTCRHYRQGVTARLGYCALDRYRTVLTGAEERPCWERSPDEGVAPPAPAAVPVTPWTEPDNAESAEIERELVAALAARDAATSRPGIRRIGLGLLDDEPAERLEPLSAEELAGSDASGDAFSQPADDLWSLYLAGPSPIVERHREPLDATVRSAGMWAESHRGGPALPPPQAPLTARHRNSRSVRHRPWGPVPGHRDALVQSLRVPDRVRRPRS